jgi:hypothetical protein
MRAALLALALVGCQPARAQEAPLCMGLADAKAMLYERYGEVSVGYGLDVTGAYVLEVFVSQSGSYTIVGISPDDQACMLAQGYEWVFVEEPWPKAGVDG